MKQPSEPIISRVEQLFRTRLIVEQCEQLELCSATSLFPKLRDLQFAIYRLDKYFERHWHLNEESISSCWAGILRTLNEITFNQRNSENLVRDIRAYQCLEERIRNPFVLSLPSVFQYYYLKTCDVRLARRLIMLQKINLPEKMKWHSRAWRLFDLISEACDDLEDISEDLLTFNGNRFLLGIGVFGASTTLDEYYKLEEFCSHQLEHLRPSLKAQERGAPMLTWLSERLGAFHTLLATRAAEINALTNTYSKSPLALRREVIGGLVRTRPLQNEALIMTV